MSNVLNHIDMLTTFKYGSIRRLLVIFIILPGIIVSYGIIQDAFPIENYLYSMLCIVVAISFAIFAIHIISEIWVTIIIGEKGISIKKLYNSYSANWEDIIEYGRDQPFGYGGVNWRYYLKISGYGDKKFKICHEKLREMKRLNAHIISKLKSARLNNIGPGMIG